MWCVRYATKRKEKKILPENLEELLLIYLAEPKISQAINLLQTFTHTPFRGERAVFVQLTARFHIDLRCCVLFSFIFYILASWLLNRMKMSVCWAKRLSQACFPLRCKQDTFSRLGLMAISKIREQLSLSLEKVPFSPILRVQIQHVTLCGLLS